MLRTVIRIHLLLSLPVVSRVLNLIRLNDGGPGKAGGMIHPENILSCKANYEDAIALHAEPFCH
jgi:hypothetical protein